MKEAGPHLLGIFEQKELHSGKYIRTGGVLDDFISSLLIPEAESELVSCRFVSQQKKFS